MDTLVAMCDVLVIRALELVGKRVVRVDRSRYNVMGDRPWHEAHTVWRPDPAMVDKALKGVWDVLPALVARHGGGAATAFQVEDRVDAYVRELLASGRRHTCDELRKRLERL